MRSNSGSVSPINSMDLSKMNSPHSMVKQVVIGFLLLGQAALLQAQKSPADARVLTDSDRAAIAAAMPAALQTPAVKPRKLLVMAA